MMKFWVLEVLFENLRIKTWMSKDEKQIRIRVVSVEETETQMREALSMRKIREIGSK